LERELEAARIADRDRSKSGTAIGSAIGLCVSKLRRSEAESKVVVLLTDGRNNAGPIDPATAAAIAWDYGIRIYTIGAGSEGPSAVRRDTPRGTEIQAVRIPMDAAALHQIAEITGGKFFRAHDTEALKEAYAEIDELETTEIEVNMHYEYEEAFMPWAAAGLGLVCASVFSRRLWFETAP
jgi:Ca-activated chloride channel family protein